MSENPMLSNDDFAQKVKELKPGDHLCCIYETEEEHRTILTSFMRQGLDSDEKIIYVVDARTAEDILHYLHQDGVDVEQYREVGQLNILSADEAYLREGVFDPDGMISLLKNETEHALTEGYPALRVTGEMTWALRGLPGSEWLIEYEAKLNEFFPGSKCLAICQYDRREFSPAILLDVLSTHPIAVIGTGVFDNFYYMPAKDHLGEEREAARLDNWLHNLAERKEAESTLKDNEQTLRAILNASTAPVLLLDTAGTILALNEACALSLGKGADEVLGSCIYHHFPPDVAAERQAQAEEVMREGRAVRFEDISRGKRFENYVYPVLNPEGKVTKLAIYALNVTERKRIEEELRQSEARLRAAIENLPFDFFLIDEEGRYAMQNAICRQHWGDIVGKRPEEVCPDERTLALWQRNNRRAFAGELVKDEVILHPHGTTGYYYNIVSPIRDGDEIRGILGVNLDITDHKLAQEALKAEKEFTEAALNAQKDTFFVFEPSTGRAIRWNKAFNEISGYTDEEIRSMKAPHSYYNEEDLKKAASATEKVLEDGTATVELSLIAKNGKSIPTEYTGSAIRDSEGNARYIIAIGRDITERKLAEKALRKAHDELESRVEKRTEELQKANLELRQEIEHRKRTEQALRESRALRSAILDSLRDHVAVIDADGRITAVNDAWMTFARDNGAPDVEGVSVGANYLAVCRLAIGEGDSAVQAALAGIEAVLEGSIDHFTTEYECSSPTERRWFLMTVLPLRGPSNDAVISHTDVTQLKAAEEELRQSYAEINSLKDNLQSRLQFESLVSELSARFVDIPSDQVDGEIERSLKHILRFFDVDRCTFVTVSPDASEAAATSVASRGELQPMPARIVVGDSFPWTFHRLIESRKPVCIDTVRDLPAEAARDRKSLEAWGVHSLLLIPIVLKETVKHVISIASHESSRVWPEEYIPRLRLLGDTFANALIRKQAEEALRSSERSLAEAQRIAHVGNWEWNILTNEVSWSDEVFRIFGVDPPQFSATYEAYLDYVHPDDRETVVKRVDRALTDPHYGYTVEHRILRPDGSQRILYVEGEVDFNRAGEPIRLFGTVQDITELKKAEEEARKHRDALSHMDRLAIMAEFGASVAHEINQPLAAILSNAQAARRFLQAEDPDLEELRRILDDIVADDRRAGEVIRRLRAFLRKGESKRERANINGLVQDVLDLMFREASARNVTIVSDLMESPPGVLADPIQIQQVVLNLIANAEQAMAPMPAEDRRLELRTEEIAQGGVTVSVRDNGPGIDEDKLEKVFDAFYTTKHEGLGMGLTISRSIIEVHGGRMWAANATDGGAKISFTLPAEHVASNKRA